MQEFSVVIYLNDILVLMSSKHAVKGAWTFLCSLLVFLRLHIIFAKSELYLTQHFFYRNILGYSKYVYISHLTNFFRYSSWLILYYRCNLMDWLCLHPPKLVLNLIPILILLSFTWRLTYTILILLGRHQMDFMCPLCFVIIGSTYQYVLIWFILG